VAQQLANSRYETSIRYIEADSVSGERISDSKIASLVIVATPPVIIPYAFTLRYPIMPA